ncbi:MAG: UvrB/UvrC motif-containing protein [Oscillospiraceae bacterium]|jgi:protein-arginine kinase activator protein McsA|nr:UvrB/UvrC motif-containing protein [Oscillospiraceae bacterium]
MKCQKCNNEATYHLHQNVNGDVTELHLCAGCAELDGDAERFAAFSAFPKMPSLTGAMFGELSGGMFAFAPRRTDISGLFPAAEPSAEPQPAADAELSRRRELNVMRENMRVAAAREDFETAAKIRDEIKIFEGAI